MIHLLKSINSWGTSTFETVLKSELECLDPSFLLLQQGMRQGSSVSESKFSVMILGVSEEAEVIIARAGIFYTSLVAGCNCADDPTPVDELSEYCEVQIEINKKTAEAMVTLLT